MQPHNSNDCNICTVTIKLAASLILAVLALCGCQNAPKQGLIVESKEKEATERLNLNTATVAEIEKLPDIGPKLAAKIVEHREKFGPFRKTSDVILVHGMSDGRFRKIRDVVTVR